eukprot:scaffold651746_cov36-Prasinocladus_malaysianus.AAC.1
MMGILLYKQILCSQQANLFILAKCLAFSSVFAGKIPKSPGQTAKEQRETMQAIGLQDGKKHRQTTIDDKCMRPIVMPEKRPGP